MKKVGIVCCSNGQQLQNKEIVDELINVLKNMNIEPVLSEHIYVKESVFSGTGEERANSLMQMYSDREISAVFDISGGDIANEVIPYLDFDIIKSSNKQFWGYSDLTTIINAIYTRTGKTSVLYQVRNLVYDYAEFQQKNFSETFLQGKNFLFDFPYKFYNGKRMEGVVVGGNIRCFLKLAGTDCFPDLHGKILFLEALGGEKPQLVTFLSQLKMLGAFEQVCGIMLGKFTAFEENHNADELVLIVKQYSGDLPLAKTQKVGHMDDSYALEIGGRYCFFV